MPAVQFFLSVSISFLFSISVAAQQTGTPPQCDPQALALLQQAIAKMGGSVPSDSVASGSITIVAGSSTQSGTGQFLTRGSDQSSEEIVTPSNDRTRIFSRDQGAENSGGSLRTLSLELSASTQSTIFPLPLLASIMTNPDSTLRYIGLETISGTNFHHLQTWNTFNSKPSMQSLTDFTVRDFWIDAASGLPWKLSYQVRAAHGDAPRQSVDVFYGDYRTVSGILFPFQISRSLNGTPWMTITIGQVQLNTGLTDATFSVCGGAQ
jgi:hypothetical protein